MSTSDEDREGRLDTVYTERVDASNITLRPLDRLFAPSWAGIDRYAYDMDVQLFDGGRRVPSSIIALSKDEVYVRTDHNFVLDTLLAFQLSMPTGVPLLLVGTVVSRGTGPTGHPGVGLRMEPLKAKPAERYRALLATLDLAEFEGAGESMPENNFTFEE